MLKNRIIPCLDVKNGRVVKGINFVDLQDAGDPVEQAKIYSDGGADEICFLDITASNENRDTIYEVVKDTQYKTGYDLPTELESYVVMLLATHIDKSDFLPKTSFAEYYLKFGKVFAKNTYNCSKLLKIITLTV